MQISNKQKERQQRTMKNLATIRKGDKVRIVECAEATRYEGQVFEVVTEPWEICGTWCVKLSGKSAFDIACLEKVEVV